MYGDGNESLSSVVDSSLWKVTWNTAAAAKSFQSCPTLCDLMDCHPQGSSAHRILQARILEWVAVPSSRRSS